MPRRILCIILSVTLLSCSHKAPYEGKSVAELQRMLRSQDAATTRISTTSAAM